MDLAGLLALVQLVFESLQLVRKLAVVFMRDVGVKNPEVGDDRLVASGLGGLALQGADLALDLLDDVLDAHEV